MAEKDKHFYIIQKMRFTLVLVTKTVFLKYC